MNKITKAVILALTSQHRNSSFDLLYGGETILNRALVAMSKSGIREVVIISTAGNVEKFRQMIGKVKHRLALHYEISELTSDQMLSDKVKEVSATWSDGFLFYETDKIIHPTFLNQVVTADASGKAVIFGYRDVIIKADQLHFDPKFKEKFKIIFANHGSFNKIIMDPLDWHIFSSNPIDLTLANKHSTFTEKGNGVFSTDVMVCTKKQLAEIKGFRSFGEAVDLLLNANNLRLQFVKEAWWLRITPEIAKSHVKELLWKIAFKEISGEFSKAVNSKMSKPLSFYFARKGVTPNTLSNAQLVLFLIASCFLIIDAHWAMILFAVIWQFSAGVLDRCDGEVARLRNHESESGGRFDMIIDDMRFGLPFIVLGFVLYFQTQNALYLTAFAASFIWFIALTLYEQNFMRKAGYTSRQVMYVDYMKLHGEQSQTTSFLKKYAPIMKGDIRTFYVFLLSLCGFKEIVFWVLLAYLTLVPISSFIGVLKFKKEYAKKVQKA